MVENVESNGCGNGLGRSGVLAGTVVLAPAAAVAVADAVEAAVSEARVSEVPVTDELPIVVAGEVSAGAGSGNACRLCGVQSERLAQLDEREERTSSAAGWERYRVERPMKTRTKGTRTTVHRMRRPRRFFWSSAYM